MTSARRTTATAVIATLLFTGTFFALPASATIPVIEIGPQLLQTILHYVGRVIEIAQKALQIKSQYDQIVNEYRMIEHQITALKTLEVHNLRDAYAALTAVENILSGLSPLAHTNGGMIERYWTTFRAYGIPVDDGFWEEQVALNLSMRSLRGSAQALSDFHQLRKEQMDVLEEIRQQLDAAEGHEETLEIIASLLAYQAEAQDFNSFLVANATDANLIAESERINRQARARTALRQRLDAITAQPVLPFQSAGYGADPHQGGVF